MIKVKICLMLLKLLFLLTLIYGNNNQSLMPECDNYFTFVCAKKDLENIKDRQDASRRMFKGIENILNSEDNGHIYDPLSMEKAWFRACMDNRHSPQDGKIIMQDILQQTGGYEWVLGDDVNDVSDFVPNKDWREIAAYYAQNFGFSPFFQVSLDEKNFLTIRKPSQWTLLDFELSLRQEADIVSSFLKTFIPPDMQTHTRFSSFQTDLLSFVRILKRILRNVRGHQETMTIEKFQDEYNDVGTNSTLEIQWLQFFRDIGMDVNEKDLMSFDLYFFKSFKEQLSYNNGIIATYIHLMYNWDENIKFYKNSDPNQEPSSLPTARQRFVECIKNMPIQKGLTEESLNTYLFDAKLMLKEIFFNMIGQFTEEINKSWLEGESKTWALNLLKKMKMRIIYLNSKHLWHTMDEISYNFSVTIYGSLQNFMNFAKAQTIYKVNKYNEYKEKNVKEYNENEAKKLYDSTTPRVFNLFVVDHLSTADKENKYKTYFIDIPFEELWRINVKASIARNYGHLATLIGRQISHGLLYATRNVGYFRYPSNHHIFEKKTNCFREQLIPYDSRDELKSIEVSVALKVAYKAFEEAMKNRESSDELEEEEEEYKTEEHEKLLDPKNLNPKQLFFLSYATISCRSIREQYDEADNNIPLDIKINIPLGNLKSFAREFNCKLNSIMNPAEKCDFWAKPETHFEKYFNFFRKRLH